MHVLNDQLRKLMMRVNYLRVLCLVREGLCLLQPSTDYYRIKRFDSAPLMSLLTIFQAPYLLAKRIYVRSLH